MRLRLGVEPAGRQPFALNRTLAPPPNLARSAHQVPRYLSYLRLLFEAIGRMPKVDNVLWRGVATDLYDTYEEGKVRL